MPALVPLLVVVAIACTPAGGAAARRRRSPPPCSSTRSASASAASTSPSLQRPDWDAVAAKLGEPSGPRAMVTWTLGEASLRYYLSTGSFQVQASEGYPWYVHEVDFISDGKVPPPPRQCSARASANAAPTRSAASSSAATACPGPSLAPLRLRKLRGADLDFRTTGVLLDGVGPGWTAHRRPRSLRRARRSLRP